MADGVDTIPRSRVIELFDAIEAVLSPFERADLRARFQEILWKHNEDQGAARLLVDHDPYFQLYDDVGTALEQMPSHGADIASSPPWYSARYPSDTYTDETDYRKRKQEERLQQQKEEHPATPSSAPRQPRPLLALDKTIRNQNIGYSGGGGSAMANVSQRSREDARIQMANAARAWQRIGGGSSSYWNKPKTQSGVAGNSTNTTANNSNDNNDKKNANAAAADVSGVPFDNLNLNQSASYTPATRRTRPTSAFTPSSRSTRPTPAAAGGGHNTRDTRIVKKKPQTSRSRLPPPPQPPWQQNLQQLSNYVKSQAAEARARAREQREQQQQREPSVQMQKTLYDLDNDVIMRELQKKQDQRQNQNQNQNQYGKRARR